MMKTEDLFAVDDDPFGADVFGQSLGSIDLWEEEVFDDDGQGDFDWAGSPSNNNKGVDKDNDDFTVATVSTRHSFSGHSRGSHPSVSTSSGSTISSHGSHFASPKACVIEALSASKRRGIQRTRSHQQPKSSTSSLASSSCSASPLKKNHSQDIQWDPSESCSSTSKRERVKPRSTPRRGYSESSKDKPRHHRQERSNRPRLADGGKSSSQRKLSSNKHAHSSPSSEERPRSSRQLFLEGDDKEHRSAVGNGTSKSKSSSSSTVVSGGSTRRNKDRRAGLTRSNSSKMSRSNRKLDSLESSTISASAHANCQGPSSRRGQLGRSTSFKMSHVKKNRGLGADSSGKEERNDEAGEDVSTDNPRKPRSLQKLTRSTSLNGSHRKPRRRTPTNGVRENSSQVAEGLPPTTPKQLTRRPSRTTPSKSKSVSQTD